MLSAFPEIFGKHEGNHRVCCVQIMIFSSHFISL